MRHILNTDCKSYLPQNCKISFPRLQQTLAPPWQSKLQQKHSLMEVKHSVLEIKQNANLPRPTMHPLPPKLRKKKDPEKLPHKINCSPFKEATQEQRKKCGYYRQDLGTYQTKYSVGINDCMHKQFELLFLHFLGNQTAKLHAS